MQSDTEWKRLIVVGPQDVLLFQGQLDESPTNGFFKGAFSPSEKWWKLYYPGSPITAIVHSDPGGPGQKTCSEEQGWWQ